MKNVYLLLLCLFLTACGAGSGGNGAVGTPGAAGKSAYEIWLEAGNNGTEQDFLDSLVGNNSATAVVPSQYVSLLQEAQAKGGYTITQMPWPEHGNFYRIVKNNSYNLPQNNTTTSGKDSVLINEKITYNEKELNLANYGVYVSENTIETEFNNELYKKYGVDTWINNREGITANVYIPAENTVFSGTTMAYLYDGTKLQLTATESITSTSTTEPVFIKGTAEYTYNETHPRLILNFDNYYTFVFQNGVSAQFSGTNDTGYDRYNLKSGNTFQINTNSVPTNKNNGSIGFVKKGDVEEVVGIYDAKFDDYTGDKIYAPNGNFRLIGAFGGTKQ